MKDPDLNKPGYIPLFQTLRGDVVESIYFGAVAVVTADRDLFAWAGDPEIVTFLRSSAKPFQAVPLVEMGGLDRFQMTGEELAITCASHSSTDSHLKTVYGLQTKIGVTEDDLLCCTHQPFDKASRSKLKDQGISPTQNHHNCSGKHTGMLGQATLMGVSKQGYTEIDHPVQQRILETFSDFCGLEPGQVQIGRDGCSVPTFAVPLFNAALGWARLVKPDGFPENRSQACQKITSAMGNHPFYVAGPGRLDTRLMELAQGKIISKAGAEAYQAAGIFENAIFPGSPALGITLKIASGDLGKRALGAVMIEVLRQLEFLSPEQLTELSDLGPTHKYRNQCRFPIGEGKPCFQLQYS
ncbi:MAG: asparaginase [Chloroflexota bacterium]|nr:MAG: asparaginase [Chloroflexota bacterium]